MFQRIRSAEPFATGMIPGKCGWWRDGHNLGIWEHRGKVVFAGIGHSPCDRRWSGESMETTLGAYAILAARLAMEDAGVTPEQIDGVIGMGSYGDKWAPHPYFAPPYDSEDGITTVSALWLIEQLGLTNVKFINSDTTMITERLGLGAQAVGDGYTNICLVLYTMNNVPGRYHHSEEAHLSKYARGNSQWVSPWRIASHGFEGIALTFREYCRKYGKSEDGLAPFAVNQRRNGLMIPWGYYTLHEPHQLTEQDYLNSRFVAEPLRVLDCDRPVNAAGCFIITTAERARDMKQKPVYILHHQEHRYAARSTQATVDETEGWCADHAQMVWEGTGLGPRDIDVFNPYEGYLVFNPLWLEAFQWHGVKRGEAFDFYAGDIRVEGPHPYLSSGGNMGVGRIRTSMFMDSIEQLRGTAGPRQVQTRCEIAYASASVTGMGDGIVMGKNPD